MQIPDETWNYKIWQGAAQTSGSRAGSLQGGKEREDSISESTGSSRFSAGKNTDPMPDLQQEEQVDARPQWEFPADKGICWQLKPHRTGRGERLYLVPKLGLEEFSCKAATWYTSLFDVNLLLVPPASLQKNKQTKFITWFIFISYFCLSLQPLSFQNFSVPSRLPTGLLLLVAA